MALSDTMGTILFLKQEPKETKYWDLDRLPLRKSINFKLKDSANINGFVIHLDFSSIRCHAEFKAFISFPECYELIVSHWIRTETNHPNKDIINTITRCLDDHSGDNILGEDAVEMRTWPIDGGLTKFTFERGQNIALHPKYMRYELSVTIEDGFCCQNYLNLQDKRRQCIDKSVDWFEFGRTCKRRWDEDQDWFPVLKFCHSSGSPLTPRRRRAVSVMQLFRSDEGQQQAVDNKVTHVQGGLRMHHLVTFHPKETQCEIRTAKKRVRKERRKMIMTSMLNRLRRLTTINKKEEEEEAVDVFG